ncbi:MAG: asparagine synthase (glutamine-hydrolyzing) [Bacteroidetes bacterium]|nr:asparagine synthase (glutamine-hydrolyzing) [Bacteroidota bacterium]
MCGLAGLIAKSGESYDFSKFKEAAKLIGHRGPDNFGEYYSGNLALFHFRLSIIDIEERSNQPFFTEDKNKVIVYNGEVYNYKELASKNNFKLHTTSDTEVLLNNFDDYGIETFKEWNGIFALAIHDRLKNTLTLARDRFGVKPLYIYEDDSFIAFASEAKIILKWLNSFKVNVQGLSEYLWYGNTLSNQTLINNLYKQTPGTSIEINLQSFSKVQKTFWSISQNHPGTRKDSFDQAVARTRELLEAAVKRQLMSDVPVGIFLSGGIDSAAITAFASRHITGKLNTYSVEYDFNIGGSELALASITAKKFKTDHHEMKVESKNIAEDFENLVFQYDEPFADSANFPLYLLAKQCSSDIKVVLQGDGGDELFAGYRRYNLLHHLKFWTISSKILSKVLLNRFLRHRADRMALALSQKSDAMRMALLLTETTPIARPEEIFNTKWKEKLYLQNPFKVYEDKNEMFKNEELVQRMLYTDFEILLPHTYLEKVDKATMLTSIEARVPFLDNDLTDYILYLPSNYKVLKGEKKYLLRKSLAGIVPDEILGAKKKGFNVPIKEWLRTSLYEYAKSKFEAFKNNNELSHIIDTKYLLKLLDEHRNSIKDHGIILWKALVLITWIDFYKDKIIFEIPQ